MGRPDTRERCRGARNAPAGAARGDSRAGQPRGSGGVGAADRPNAGVEARPEERVADMVTVCILLLLSLSDLQPRIGEVPSPPPVATVPRLPTVSRYRLITCQACGNRALLVTVRKTPAGRLLEHCTWSECPSSGPTDHRADERPGAAVQPFSPQEERERMDWLRRARQAGWIPP